MNLSNIINKKEKVSLKEYIGYFFYGFGQCLSFGVVGTFLLIFYTDVFKISALAASAIFFIARVWDAINDPLLAAFIDKNQKPEKDKFRPLLLIMPFFIAITTAALFFNFEASNAVKITYALITYLLWGMIYTVSDVSFWSISTVISSISQQRTKLITMGNLGVFGGIGLAGALLPFAKNQLQKWFSIDINMQYVLGVVLIMFLMTVPFSILGSKVLKERVKPKDTGKMTFKQVFEVLKSNKPLRIILIIYFLNIFMNIVQGMAPFFFKWNLQSEDLFQLYSILTVFSAIGFLIIPYFTKRFSKVSILKTILVIDILLRLIFYFVGYEYSGFTVGVMAVLFFLYGMTAPILSVMIADTIEYAEYKTGKRAEALIFSGQTFAGKLSVALAGTLSGLILAFIHYNPELKVQTNQTLKAFFIIIVLLPCVGSIARLLLLSFYKYREKHHEIILNRLSRRVK